MSVPPKLAIRQVHKAFGATRVLDGMSLDVTEHEVVCLIGSSGSGKSGNDGALDRSVAGGAGRSSARAAAPPSSSIATRRFTPGGYHGFHAAPTPPPAGA